MELKDDGVLRLYPGQRTSRHAVDDIEWAIRREKRLKKYTRDWKINLIEHSNPRWDDLYDRIANS